MDVFWKKYKKKIILEGILLIVAWYLGGIVVQMGNPFPESDAFGTTVETFIQFGFQSLVAGLGTTSGWLIRGGLFLLGNVVPQMVKARLPKGHRLDEDRNFSKSDRDTYGTSGWMTDEERSRVLDEVNPKKTDETILGTLNGNAITLPNDSRLNKHIAIYGASGTGKSRAFARNYILQGAKRGESFVVTDPKGELFESMAPYLADNDYTVRVLNIKDSAGMLHSNSWNCLAEIEGDEINAQIFADTIIQNTSEGEAKSDFWSQCEMNLLKSLCLLVERSPAYPTNIGEVYNLISGLSSSQLDMLFDTLPNDSSFQSAKAAYNVYRQAGDNVRGGAVIGLGSRLQIFQAELPRKITTYNEIDLTLPGKQKCAYFCITSDQQSAFDFLAVLFYSMMFIKLVNYADSRGGRCEVPVNFLLDEFPNIGAIPDFTKKISTIRSRGLNVAVIFQNIAQLQNRYPFGKWEEILGNCDTHLFLGCTDATTAKFVSDRSGVVTIDVKSEARSKHLFRVLEDVDFKQTESVGKRNLLTPDEVLRLNGQKSLVIVRGEKPLKIDKFDYSQHPDAKKLHTELVKDYVPDWTKRKENRSFVEQMYARIGAEMPEELLLKKEDINSITEAERKSRQKLSTLMNGKPSSEADTLKIPAAAEQLRKNSDFTAAIMGSKQVGRKPKGF